MRMKPANLGSIIAKLIAAVMLFTALGRQAYDYYTILRLIACGVAAFTAFQAAQIKKFGWLFVFVMVAMALNPIAPLHLKRDTWKLVDTAAGVLLLLAIAVVDIRKTAPASAAKPPAPAPAPPPPANAVETPVKPTEKPSERSAVQSRRPWTTPAWCYTWMGKSATPAWWWCFPFFLIILVYLVLCFIGP
jgi:hypothetical protein